MMGTRVSFLDQQHPLEGYQAAPDSARGLPVAPNWLNVNKSICRRTDRLAELGFVAFLADLFGAGVRPSPPQSPMTVVGPLLDGNGERTCQWIRKLDCWTPGIREGYSLLMTLSARNHLKGKIVELQLGGVMAHVVIKVGENLIESVITKRSADEMKLKVGDEVSAIIKSTEVMLEKA